MHDLGLLSNVHGTIKANMEKIASPCPLSQDGVCNGTLQVLQVKPSINYSFLKFRKLSFVVR